MKTVRFELDYEEFYINYSPENMSGEYYRAEDVRELQAVSALALSQLKWLDEQLDDPELTALVERIQAALRKFEEE